CGAQIISASWVDLPKPPNGEWEGCMHMDNRYTYLNLTVSAPQNPQAIGTLVFSDDNGHHEQFSDEPLRVNDKQ
ncbi:18399_t:CDS:1, partial [Racocetra fulgida]